MNPIALAAILGALGGIVVTLAAWRFITTEYRLRALEQQQKDSVQQKRLTHHQQNQLESLAFTFGQLLANRKTEDEFLTNIYNRLGALLDDGPNGDSEKKYTKYSRRRLK